MTPLQVCQQCESRERPCNGPCACRVDGRQITDHAAEHDCPRGLYPARGLGDTVAAVVKAATLGTVHPCGGCRERRDKLNALLPYYTPPGP